MTPHTKQNQQHLLKSPNDDAKIDTFEPLRHWYVITASS